MPRSLQVCALRVSIFHLSRSLLEKGFHLFFVLEVLENGFFLYPLLLLSLFLLFSLRELLDTVHRRNPSSYRF